MQQMMNAQRQQEIDEKRYEALEIIATSVFSSKLGKQLLKLLEEQFINKPVWIYDAKDEFSAFREGQNDMVRNLIKWSTPSQTLEK